MARGRSKEALRLLRKRFKLGEFAPKRGKRLAKRAAKAARAASRRSRKLATVNLEDELMSSRLISEEKPDSMELLGRMQRGNRRIRSTYTGRTNPVHGVPYLADPYSVVNLGPL